MTKDSNPAPTANQKPIIALDCDGVLLDHVKTFGLIYEKAFGKTVSIVSPKSHRSHAKYNVNFNEEEEIHFENMWREHAWKQMPMIEGALEACWMFYDAGYELVCVTAMAATFIDERLENFRLHGFPIHKVISTGYDKHNRDNNPKKSFIEELHPVAFVDDLLRNFKDIEGVHTKLIFIDNGSEYPNRYSNIHYDAKYSSLLEFAKEFLKSEQHGSEIQWPERPSTLLKST